MIEASSRLLDSHLHRINDIKNKEKRIREEELRQQRSVKNSVRQEVLTEGKQFVQELSSTILEEKKKAEAKKAENAQKYSAYLLTQIKERQARNFMEAPRTSVG